MAARFLSRLLGVAVRAPAPPAAPAAPAVVAAPPPVVVAVSDRAALIAEAMRIRAEMRARIGVEKLRVLHRALTGKDPE